MSMTSLPPHRSLPHGRHEVSPRESILFTPKKETEARVEKGLAHAHQLGSARPAAAPGLLVLGFPLNSRRKLPGEHRSPSVLCLGL